MLLCLTLRRTGGNRERSICKEHKSRENALVSNIHHHVDPMRYPKVQEGYEGMAQVIFSTQINNMLMDLTKKMVSQKSK